MALPEAKERSEEQRSVGEPFVAGIDISVGLAVFTKRDGAMKQL